jgi:homopolymeric O-antigen transport system ATP-binding protein
MSDLALRVQDLSKTYVLGAPPPATMLREQMVLWARRALGRAPAPNTTDFWALRDVSFDVRRGEIVSLIGRNGAGKSTLLKILSKIVEPSQGRAEIYGRIGSLLEVGTGFHPELSGRENVYLNAAILGMRRTEIARRFDEIVAFAEIDRFIDVPVKRYSSGMYVRLAFAVAAHLDPEILIVDEVLAVGDAAFQRKCLGKLGSVAREGRTVVFVSHDMNAVTALSRRALLIEQGRLALDGAARDVVGRYLGMQTVERRGERRLEAPAEAAVVVTAARTLGAGGETTAVLPRSSAIVVALDGEVRRPPREDEEHFVALDVHGPDDVRLFRTHNVEQRWFGAVPRDAGPFRLTCTVPAELLVPGAHRLGLIVGVAGRHHTQEVYPLLEIDVVQDRLLADLWTGHVGVLTPRCEWKLVS